MDDEDEVVGYFQCRDCNEYVVKGTQITQYRLCTECARKRTDEMNDAVLTYEVEGRVFRTGGLPKARRRTKAKRTPEQDARKGIHRDARVAALNRLAVLHKPDFELLFAEEKAKRGLAPDRLARIPQATRVADEILAESKRNAAGVAADAEERRLREVR